MVNEEIKNSINAYVVYKDIASVDKVRIERASVCCLLTLFLAQTSRIIHRVVT